MFIVPIFQNISSKFTMQVNLENVNYKLRIAWNTREEAWKMNVLDINDNVLISEVKLVSGFPLLRQFEAKSLVNNLKLPQGDFVLVDLENNPQTSVVTYNNLGTRYQLVFFNREELA